MAAEPPERICGKNHITKLAIFLSSESPIFVKAPHKTLQHSNKHQQQQQNLRRVFFPNTSSTKSRKR